MVFFRDLNSTHTRSNKCFERKGIEGLIHEFSEKIKPSQEKSKTTALTFSKPTLKSVKREKKYFCEAEGFGPFCRGPPSRHDIF